MPSQTSLSEGDHREQGHRKQGEQVSETKGKRGERGKEVVWKNTRARGQEGQAA